MQDEGYGGLSPDNSECEYIAEADGTMSVIESVCYGRPRSSIVQSYPVRTCSMPLPQPLDVKLPKLKKERISDRRDFRQNYEMNKIKNQSDGSGADFAYEPSCENCTEADDKYIMSGLKALSCDVLNNGQRLSRPLSPGIDRLTKEVRRMGHIVTEMESIERPISIQYQYQRDGSSSESSFVMFSGCNSSRSSVVEQPRNSHEVTLSKTFPNYTDRPSSAQVKGKTTSGDGGYCYNSRSHGSPKLSCVHSCTHRCLPSFEPFEVSQSVRDLYRLVARTENNYELNPIDRSGSFILDHGMQQDQCTDEFRKASNPSVKMTQYSSNKVRRRIGRGRLFNKATSASCCNSQVRRKKPQMKDKSVLTMDTEDGIIHEQLSLHACQEEGTSNTDGEVGEENKSSSESLHTSVQLVKCSPYKKNDCTRSRSAIKNHVKVAPFVSMSQQNGNSFSVHANRQQLISLLNTKFPEWHSMGRAIIYDSNCKDIVVAFRNELNNLKRISVGRLKSIEAYHENESAIKNSKKKSTWLEAEFAKRQWKKEYDRVIKELDNQLANGCNWSKIQQLKTVYLALLHAY